MFFMILVNLAASARVGVEGLRTENLDNPLGLDVAQPRFSWRLSSDKKNVRQKSYRILVASTPDLLEQGRGDLWDSGVVRSGDQLWIAYAGKTLKSNQRGWWKVLVETDRDGSAWSAPARFGIGLLGESRWGGRWIGLERLVDGEERGLRTRLAARRLRKEFRLEDKEIKRATAYVAGLGLYHLHINGHEVGADDLLKPVPSDYRRTVYYNAYDVTELMKPETAVAVELGNGRFFPMRQNKPYKIPVFGLPKCRINIIVEYADGTSARLVTDESWRVSTDGPVRSNNEYDGEIYDARMEMAGWTEPGFDDSGWLRAERAALPDGTLRGQITPAMRAGKAVKPLRIWSRGDTAMVDFGQNMAGWISFVPDGAAGERSAVGGYLCVPRRRTAALESVVRLSRFPLCGDHGVEKCGRGAA